MATYGRPDMWQRTKVNQPLRARYGAPDPWQAAATGQQARPLPSAAATSNAGSIAAAPPKPVTAPATPGTQAIPNEGVYQQDQAGAQRAYDDAMESLRTKELGIQQQFGFNPQGGVDGNNPYSEYFQLKNSQGRQLDQAREMAMERGLGGRGLGAQVQEAPRYEQGVQDAAFQREYLGQMGGVAAGRNSAKHTFDAALQQARWNQINSAIQQEAWSSPEEEQLPPASAAKEKLVAAVTKKKAPIKAAPVPTKKQQKAINIMRKAGR